MSGFDFFPGDFHSIEQALEKEWLLTNGIGGFASGTILGVNTRRYHGLLIGADRPPSGRTHALAKLEENLILPEGAFSLSINQYHDVFHPDGDRRFAGFTLDVYPEFEYRVGRTRIVKSAAMPHGENAIVVRYRFYDVVPGSFFEVRPMLTCRDFHGRVKENPYARAGVECLGAWDRAHVYDETPPVCFYFAGSHLEPDPQWNRNVFLAKEMERGLEAAEDYLSPGFWRISLDSEEEALFFKAALFEPGPAPGDGDFERAKRRGNMWSLPADLQGSEDEKETEAVRRLTRAADGFIVVRRLRPPGKAERESKSILAGYPWFSDWGRDAMIALPGLTLCTGRFQEAREILSTFVHYLDGGMLPNRFPDGDEPPDYNTVDAAMWLFMASHQYLAYTKDWDFARDVLTPALAEVVRRHEEGTRYGIHEDIDGLIVIGDAQSQLTWMDARVGGNPVTPRAGKPVEVNALWVFGLWFLCKLKEHFNENPSIYFQKYTQSKASFEKMFWNSEKQCLFDVIHDKGNDASIRPNQVVALSLPISLLSKEKAAAAWETVDRELYTPYGLRSLAPGSDGYRARYEGEPARRDGAYHQGTAWGWLLGPHLTAYRNIFGRTEATQREVKRRLKPVWGHLGDAGLGWISEIFDAEPPFIPRGCIAQAWSVAEVLRVCLEEALGRRPGELWPPAGQA